MKLKILTLMLLLAVLVNANFGQTAGELDFGTLEPNQTKSMTYSLVNTGEEDINFEIYPNNDLIIQPMQGVIESKSQTVINVTTVLKETGNYSGEVRAKLLGNESGTVVLKLELGKIYKFEVAEKTVELAELGNPREIYLVYMLIVIFIFTICIFIIAYKLEVNKNEE